MNAQITIERLVLSQWYKFEKCALCIFPTKKPFVKISTGARVQSIATLLL